MRETMVKSMDGSHEALGLIFIKSSSSSLSLFEVTKFLPFYCYSLCCLNRRKDEGGSDIHFIQSIDSLKIPTLFSFYESNALYCLSVLFNIIPCKYLLYYSISIAVDSFREKSLLYLQHKQFEFLTEGILRQELTRSSGEKKRREEEHRRDLSFLWFLKRERWTKRKKT